LGAAANQALRPSWPPGSEGLPKKEDANFAPSFAEDTAHKTGQSKRKVQLDAQRGEEIGAADFSRVVGTSLELAPSGSFPSRCAVVERYTPSLEPSPIGRLGLEGAAVFAGHVVPLFRKLQIFF
jgi:hypothetical protein